MPLAFGRPGSAREGQAGFPQLRLVGLAECGTHAIVAAAMGPYRGPERELVRRLLPALQPEMLCLADRGLYSFQLWQQAQAQGAALLWRIGTKPQLEASHRFADGSYLAQVYDHADRRRVHGMTARVIDYLLDDPGRPSSTHYRLLTNLLAPDQAPARELAALYAQRWEFETTLDELKIHQRGPRVVLRSKFPEGVYQEAYGYLLTHYAIRALMHDAAVEAGLDPDRLSFLRSLRVVRRSTASVSFSPDKIAAVRSQAIAEIVSVPLPERRLRSSPRMVKRKMTRYHVKRLQHRHWPQPTRSPQEAILILK